jgi:hypothetical protein
MQNDVVIPSASFPSQTTMRERERSLNVEGNEKMEKNVENAK